jgi:hypothetical protein
MPARISGHGRDDCDPKSTTEHFCQWLEEVRSDGLPIANTRCPHECQYHIVKTLDIIIAYQWNELRDAEG